MVVMLTAAAFQIMISTSLICFKMNLKLTMSMARMGMSGTQKISKMKMTLTVSRWKPTQGILRMEAIDIVMKVGKLSLGCF